MSDEIESKIKPIQKIFFGSPGTGKSYRIRELAEKELKIQWNHQSKSLENTIKTVFHPEYTYSDFVGKLLPQTTDNSVIYKYYEGHFLRALGLAYKHLIEETKKNVLLVIDELNRGNAAAIFGPVFQLLDREEDNWSSYQVDLSDLEIVGLLRAMKYNAQTTYTNIQVDGSNFDKFYDFEIQKIEQKNNAEGLRVLENLKNRRIAIPSNLSIIATINTSDESIYYLDSAFKRRWDWEYVDVPGGQFSVEVPEIIKDTRLINEDNEEDWSEFVINLNEFIKYNNQAIRRIEDKQIGWWFLKPENNQISIKAIENKLMFYLWDSVFSKDRKPLAELLTKTIGESVKLITYADFIALSEAFVLGIFSKKWK